MAQLPNAPLPHSLSALQAEPYALQEGSSTKLFSEIHDHHIPAFASTALDRLYGSLFASQRHLELCGENVPVPHTWIAYRHGEVVAVFLFRIEASRVLVLTEMIAPQEEHLNEFRHAVFARYPKIWLIVFNAIILPAAITKSACQWYAFSENYILDLPPSVTDYLSSIGKSTRKTIQGYSNRLKREFPDFKWETYTAAEIPRHQQRALLRQLQAFKSDSMSARGKQALLDKRDRYRLMILASECGLFGVARVKGKVVAGSLACRFGDSYVMLLSAADPEMEPFRLGLLACYWSVCDCIRAQARQCHLLWGRYRYKSQLLAVPHTLFRLNMYRSRKVMLSHFSMVMTMWGQSLRYRFRHWLLNQVHERQDVFSLLVSRGLNRLRLWRVHVQKLKHANG